MTDALRQLRRKWLPSRTLGHYAAKSFLIRFLLVLGLLVTLLQTLDLLTEQTAILSADDANRASLLQYVSLRAPQLINQFTPFAALLAMLLTLTALAQHSEITVMRAAGMSSHRILFPFGLVCAGIAGLHFAFQEVVVVDASAALAFWKDNDYAADLPPPPDNRRDVWLTDKDVIIAADRVTQTGDRTVLDDVTLYRRDQDGQLSVSAAADFAWHDGQWTLFNLRRFSVDGHQMEVIDVSSWPVALRPERFFTSNIVPEQTSLPRLGRLIRMLAAENQPTEQLRTAWFHRLSRPMASFLMPLMGAIAGFGLARSGALFARVVIGMALGFGYFVAENFMIAMGNLGVVPPEMAAFAPVTFFVLAGYSMLFLVEE